jgi:hypothetical protein
MRNGYCYLDPSTEIVLNILWRYKTCGSIACIRYVLLFKLKHHKFLNYVNHCPGLKELCCYIERVKDLQTHITREHFICGKMWTWLGFE